MDDVSKLGKAVALACKERFALDSRARQRYFDLGKDAASEVDVSRWEPLVKGWGHETALACAIEAAYAAIPNAEIPETMKRALGTIREGLKSGLYVRLLKAR